jgi:hypothetical protein
MWKPPQKEPPKLRKGLWKESSSSVELYGCTTFLVTHYYGFSCPSTCSYGFTLG